MTNQFPKQIAEAIVKVMGEVKTLARDGRNTYEGYNFTSVDAFYDFVRPLCAEAGIFLVVDLESSSTLDIERETKNGPKTTKYLVLSYLIKIAHEAGEASDPVRREVMVVASGPQSYAAADSFVTKYFMRNLFQIPTGEADDADLHEAKPLPKKQSKKGSETEAKIKAFVDAANEFIDGKPDAEAVIKWEDTNGAKLKWLREQKHDGAQAMLKRIEALYDESNSDTDKPEPKAKGD